MSLFHLHILTTTRVFYTGDCQSLVVPLSDGMIGIRAGHVPITASVTFGEAYYINPDGRKVVFSITAGILDVQDDAVRLLCESALLPEEIDEEAARTAEENARLELAKEQSHTDYLMSKLLLNNAINNLKVKRKNTVN